MTGSRLKNALVLAVVACTFSLALASPDWAHSFELMSSVMKEHPEQVLATFKADPLLVRQNDQTGRTVLHLAAQNGNRPLIQFLAAQGLNLDISTRGGVTPLIAACIAQNYDTASALLEAGANPRGKYSDTPLHLVAGCGRGLCAPLRGQDTEWLALARLLLDKGAKINACGDNDATPLHYAAEANNPGMVDLLILRGATPDSRDSDGNTPLHLAVRTVSARSAQALLKAGCNRDLRNKAGETPLDMARRNRLSPKIITLLSH